LPWSGTAAPSHPGWPLGPSAAIGPAGQATARQANSPCQNRGFSSAALGGSTSCCLRWSARVEPRSIRPRVDRGPVRRVRPCDDADRRSTRGMKISFATTCCVVVVAGVLLWLNLRSPEWLQGYGLNTNSPPEGLDPITKVLFLRGWPFVPCGYCYLNLSGWHPDRSGGSVQLAAFADILIFILVLAITGVICEWCSRFWKRRQTARSSSVG
jgi:hypothetical protein